MLMTVRVVAICWEWPHLELEWERLPAVAELAQKHFHPEDMHQWESKALTHYMLPKNELVSFTHILLAMEQVLQDLHGFLGCPHKDAFRLDPNFQFLRAMAWNKSQTEISVTAAILQKCATVTAKHVKVTLNGL
jgi:hypothetical protein